MGIGSQRMAELIAYLSLCMLAVAWGTMLGPAWCRCWAIFGLWGLGSAIGLDILDRSRARSLIREQEEKTNLRVEQNLSRLINDVHSADTIRAALHRIMQNGDDAKSHGPMSREGTRLSLHRQVTMTPLPISTNERSGDSFTGYVRDVSSSGIGLIHDGPLERNSVLLDFEFENDEHIQFVADVLWCELQEDGRYFSGGKLIELVTSLDDISSKLLSENPNQCPESSIDDQPTRQAQRLLGRRVRIQFNDVDGLAGTVLARRGTGRLWISVDSGQHEVYLDVPEDTVELID